MKNNRSCLNCGESIGECMGFVLAGDFLKLNPEQKNSEQIEVRETCGKCVLVKFVDVYEKEILEDLQTIDI